MMPYKDAEEQRKDGMMPTEVTETRYMGEGAPGQPMDPTERTEVAYMGEPEESNEPRHETEYNKGRTGPKIGKATLETHKHTEKKESA